MTVRRQLLNFSGRNVDFRFGVDAIDDMSKLARGAVGKPRRALLADDGSLDRERFETVRRSLVDAGFEVVGAELGDEDCSLAAVSRLVDGLSGAGITAEDLIVCTGAERACAVASLAAKLWCGGSQLMLVPTTLSGMVLAATETVGMDSDGSRGMLSLRPEPSMVVADLSIVVGATVERSAWGLILMLGAHLADSKRSWDRFGENAGRIADGDAAALADALATSQTARRSVIAAANPSARAALGYGVTTARALRRCLGGGEPWWRLLAEGMRFEARIATEAAGFDVDQVFEQDDRFEDLGIEELGFELDAGAFLDALRSSRLERANRLLFSLPRTPGTIRLTAVDDEVLRRHAEAYLASRVELLREN